MKKTSKSLLCIGLVTMSTATYAATPAAPTLSEVLEASGVTLTGAMDLSYSALSGTGQFIPAPGAATGINSRVFDYAHNSFGLQAIDLTIAKQPAEGFGGLVDFTMGKDASTVASYGTLLAGATPGQTQTYDITQAYAQLASGSLTVIAGKFATLAGQEYIKSSTNTNFSRSILFGYAIPFTHTGMRATYKVSDAFSLIGGVNNGWDQATDANSGKTVELAFAWTPAKSFGLIAQDYNGAEQVAGTPGGAQGKRNLLDMVATFTVSDSLNFVLNYDNGSQANATATGSAKWSGVAAYANYQISQLWRASVRAETFDDKDGYRTGIAQKWKEATLTVGYAPDKSMELRFEVRKDTSDKASFAYNDGIARKSQHSVGMEAIYKF